MKDVSLLSLLVKTPEAERAAVLERECAGQPELKEQIQDWLNVYALIMDEGPPAGPSEPISATIDLRIASTGSMRGAVPDDTHATIVHQREAGGARSGQQFGDYQLLNEIARGGMGVVYRARQAKLNRLVAVKMILAGELADEDAVRRFYSEAEAAANLNHVGIVPIYEVGEHAGQHFFSMGFIEGTSLAARVAAGPLPPREAVELTQKITVAIAYAHSRGVFHRDLKPANILLDQHGEPKVTDFGLAKRITGESGLTQTGAILGTPSYMPPEQAAGKTNEIGPAADVYSLGAILYCLVTGRPPFQAASPLDTVLQVLTQEPISPRLLNAKTPRDLETICLKCLDKDPARRYASAQALAAELGRYLAGEPIVARPLSRLARGVRWCRRKPLAAAVAGLAASLVAALALGTPVTTYFMLEAKKQEGLAIKEAGEKDLALLAESAQKAKAEDAAEKERQEREKAESRLVQVERGVEILGSVFASLNARKAEKDGQSLRELLGKRLDRATAELDEQAVGDELAVARLQFLLAESQLELGYPEKAIGLALKAQKTSEKHFGLDHVSTFTSQDLLAKAYQEAGQLDLALPIFEETLRRRKTRLDPDDPKTLESMNNLARAYQANKQLDKALPLFEEAYKLAQAKLGDSDAVTLTIMNNLAIGWYEARQLDKALPCTKWR